MGEGPSCLDERSSSSRLTEFRSLLDVNFSTSMSSLVGVSSVGGAILIGS